MKIGIDIGGSHIGIGVVSKDFEIIDSVSIYTVDMDRNNMQEIIIKNIISKILEFENKYGKTSEIGIGIPGKIKDFVVYDAKNLNITKFEIKKELEKTFNVKINVQNDALCAAKAEHKLGNLKGKENAVFLCLGTGIGSVVIYKNEYLEIGKELGHMMISDRKVQCSCGKTGCFEVFCSIKKLRKLLSERLNTTLKVEEILLNYDISLYEDILEEYTEYLVKGLINIIEIFNTDVICLGGSFSKFENTVIFEKINTKLKNEIIYTKKTDVNKEILIVPAKFLNKAGIIGSLL